MQKREGETDEKYGARCDEHDRVFGSLTATVMVALETWNRSNGERLVEDAERVRVEVSERRTRIDWPAQLHRVLRELHDLSEQPRGSAFFTVELVAAQVNVRVDLLSKRRTSRG